MFNTALAEIIEEINALRKDRETLYRVRSAVELRRTTRLTKIVDTGT